MVVRNVAILITKLKTARSSAGMAGNSGNKKFSEGNKAQSKSTSASVISTVSLTTESYNDVVLPTATVYVRENGKNRSLRVFKDIGSQSSFVRGTPDSIPNCRVVRSIDINIKGINSAKLYKSHVVQFPVEVPGQGMQTITAVCVPSLSTEVAACGLASLSKKFRDEGVELADRNIDSDSISDIAVLIGSDQGHIFPLTQLTYGGSEDCNPSVLYRTPTGVMLSGSVSDYERNMQFLPEELRNRD